MISKQVLLGSVLVLAGGATLFAVATNGTSHTASEDESGAATVATPVVQPLTADAATEERLLAQKRREREAHTQKMQQEAEALLKAQEEARNNALEKANFERVGGAPAGQEASADSAAKSEIIAIPSVQTRPEAIAAAKAAEEAKKAEEAAKAAKAAAERQAAQAQAAEKKPEAKKPEAPTAVRAGTYTVQSGESWRTIANRAGISATALAEANGVTRYDTLRVGRNIQIPSAAQVARLEQAGRAREAKRAEEQKKAADKKAAEAAKAEKAKADKAKADAAKAKANTSAGAKQNPHLAGRYTVQVALTPDRAKADRIVRQYRAAGYTVNTSNTTRGTRIIIGGERSEAGARALKGRIDADSRVRSEGATFIHQVQ